ncbi:hypothetical protein MIND_00574900 [Mycena indigotica]|uniref:Uncharacterized protein n=1 Tax=Mycena indigotica TaxID=2126181 RepID=A0A8H6SRM9_9AGAR|nr:uncharacterized protein MIND_00574900 [Mycena indigotica]KAF7303461.1 hypothetical protein MIND_00574900 [Mycena indigotica]
MSIAGLSHCPPRDNNGNFLSEGLATTFGGTTTSKCSYDTPQGTEECTYSNDAYTSGPSSCPGASTTTKAAAGAQQPQPTQPNTHTSTTVKPETPPPTTTPTDTAPAPPPPSPASTHVPHPSPQPSASSSHASSSISPASTASRSLFSPSPPSAAAADSRVPAETSTAPPPSADLSRGAIGGIIAGALLFLLLALLLACCLLRRRHRRRVHTRAETPTPFSSVSSLRGRYQHHDHDAPPGVSLIEHELQLRAVRKALETAHGRESGHIAENDLLRDRVRELEDALLYRTGTRDGRRTELRDVDVQPPMYTPAAA